MNENDATGAVTVEELAEPLSPDAAKLMPHHIIVTFTDGMSLNGAKIDATGVTPEQIMAAVYHLTRAANMETDRLMMQAARERSEIRDVMAEIARGAGKPRNGRH